MRIQLKSLNEIATYIKNVADDVFWDDKDNYSDMVDYIETIKNPKTEALRSASAIGTCAIIFKHNNRREVHDILSIWESQMVEKYYKNLIATK